MITCSRDLGVLYSNEYSRVSNLYPCAFIPSSFIHGPFYHVCSAPVTWVERSSFIVSQTWFHPPSESGLCSTESPAACPASASSRPGAAPYLGACSRVGAAAASVPPPPERGGRCLPSRLPKGSASLYLQAATFSPPGSSLLQMTMARSVSPSSVTRFPDLCHPR